MILDLLKNDGISPQQKGAAEYASPCPGCGGDDRFVIFSDSDRYWCRQCGASGDSIQYLRDFHRMNFRDATVAVGKLVPKTVLQKPNRMSYVKKDVDAVARKTVQPSIWRKRMDDLSDWAHQQLLNNPTTLEWLRTERGISVETAKRFRLGWIDRNYYLKRQEVGLDDTGKKLFIPSGLTIPWQDVRVRIRRDKPGEYGRYYIIPKSKSDPFIIGNFNENTAVILESELDAIVLAQESTRPLFIVALGSAQKKPDEALMEMLNLCPVVLVALDNDQAGAVAARWWLENMSNSFRTLIPKEFGKDITDGHMAKGLDLNDWLCVSMEICSGKIVSEQARMAATSCG